jgi:hypothetical protein
MLQGLIEGRVTPEQANDWACLWVRDDSTHPEVMDEAIWNGLLHLCGADLPGSANELLHREVDLRAWLEEFDRLSTGHLGH